jgi:hypothetical protein
MVILSCFYAPFVRRVGRFDVGRSKSVAKRQGHAESLIAAPPSMQMLGVSSRFLALEGPACENRTMAVDTLEYAKELQAAGASPQQAEAHARALKKAVDAGLVTKPDLDQAVALIRTDIARLDGKIDQNIARGDG